MEVQRDGKLTIVHKILAKVRGPAPYLEDSSLEGEDNNGHWLHLRRNETSQRELDERLRELEERSRG